jgi:hypothetical protein
LSSVPPGREIDTRDGLRALGITAVVANHAFAAPVHGGLNLLFLVSGIAFAQLCFRGRDRSALVVATMRFARPLAVWSVVLCLFWFAVFGRFEPAELLMVGNWFATERVSKFPIWYTQVMLQMLLGIVALLALPGMLERVRRAPVPGTAAWLAGAVALAVAAQFAVDTDHLADKLPHLHAWNFVLGWLFWAVLHTREASGTDRALLTACCVPLMLVMFLGLGVPGAEARVWVAIPATVLLIWAPMLRLPRPLAQPVLLIGQAVLFIFFLHYPFLLAIRNLLAEHLQPLALQSLQFAAGIAGPVLLWAVVTAAQRTLAHARMRRGETERVRVAREHVVSA